MKYGQHRRQALTGGLTGLLLLGLTLIMVIGRVAHANEDVQPVVDTIEVGDAKIEIVIEPGFRDETRVLLKQWVLTSAKVVSDYFGQFPAKHSSVVIRHGTGHAVRSGTTNHYPELHVQVTVGHDVTADELRDDWIMVHEMVHLSLPQVPRQQNWFHEGAATYIEIIARAQSGLTSPDFVWRQLVKAMRQGLPQDGDQGLDHTPTWGRTYWGGAMFFLLADVEIHRLTNNRMGLQEAMQGIAKAGGHYGQFWPLSKTMRIADDAVGLKVLAQQYWRMKDQPVGADLDDLWKQMGIMINGKDIQFSDQAPLASVRLSITRPRHGHISNDSGIRQIQK